MADKLMLPDVVEQSDGAISSPECTTPLSGTRRQLITDTLNYFLSKIVPGFTGFVSVLVFVRLLGVEQYGRYAVVFAVVTAAAAGMAGWLAQGILRFQSQVSKPGESQSFLQASVRGAALSMLLGGCVLGVLIRVSGIQKGWPLVISVGLFAVLLLYTVVLARFQAALRSGQVLRFEIVRSVGSFAIPLVAMLLTGSRAYWLLLLGIGLGYSLPLMKPMVSGATSALRSGRRTNQHFSTGEQNTLARLWHFGWPVALWLLGQQLLMVSDRVLLQRFAGYSEAGVYSSIYDVTVRSFSLLFMPVTLAIHPLVMSRWNAGDAQSALSALRVGVKYQVLLFLPIALSFGIFASWMSRFVLGKDTPQAASIVLPLAASGFLWQLCLLAHKPLEILCLTKRMLAGMLVALTVNIAGNWLLIPKFGYRASAYLSVASSATYLLMLFVLTPIQELRRAAARPVRMTGLNPDSASLDRCLFPSL